jgi:hypothetical protein
MAKTDGAKAGEFFASRSGVCVYVTIQQQAYRVRFVSPDAHGVVVDGQGAGAEAALGIARVALRQNAANLAPLFEKAARSLT